LLDVSADSSMVEDSNFAHHHHHHHHRKLAQVNADSSDPPIGTLQNSTTGVPLLHSRAGSNLRIYLDFDGHDTIGTFWNTQNSSSWACSKTNCATITSPAYNQDGVAGFSDLEKRLIVSIWIFLHMQATCYPIFCLGFFPLDMCCETKQSPSPLRCLNTL
jgi:hypothetical protein